MLHKHHTVLTKASDFRAAKKNVLNFFTKTMLLHYDIMEVSTGQSYQAGDPGFWPALEEGIAENRRVLAGFIQELHETGCRTTADLNTIPHGYPSKIFHIIAHLLDGFVGVDSMFYNLLEDSHWLSEPLRQTIRENRDLYWLIHLEVSFTSAATASLIHGEA